MKLCGDIGGTKVLLGLVDDSGNIVGERRFASADFSDFAPLLAEFLSDKSIRDLLDLASPIDGGCLALAGPVEDDGRTARITNLPWIVDAAALEARFDLLGPVRLVNDFVGAAMGVTALASAELIVLQAGEPLADGVKLVIGAGTGLGMATLVADVAGFRVLPGEGGHVGFAPADAVQARVWTSLLSEFGRVTAERVISGPGLAAIHRVLASEALDPAIISERALAGEATARHSVDVFLAAYGAYAGDMAKILPLMQNGPFLAAFNAKAEHAALAARMPVYVTIDPQLGLKGAAILALDSG